MLGIWILFFELVWIGAILKRLPRDIHEVRFPGNPENRYVVLFYWVVTAVIAVPPASLAWHFAKPILVYYRIVQP